MTLKRRLAVLSSASSVSRPAVGERHQGLKARISPT
jgi:hypothetical protein